MELREWLIILGLALVSLIVVDGVRRLQRQRRVPRLDQAVRDLPKAKLGEFDDEAKEAEINWELPNGGARVVKPADYSGLGQKPKLERQEHPGPSKVLSDFRRSFSKAVPKQKTATNLKAEPVAAAQPQKQSTSFAKPVLNVAKAAFTASSTPAEYKPTESTACEQERREPSISMAAEAAKEPVVAVNADTSNSESTTVKQPPTQVAVEQPAQSSGTVSGKVADVQASEQEVAAADVDVSVEQTPSVQAETAAILLSAAEDEVSADKTPETRSEESQEPVLRAEPEDAVFAKQPSDAPKPKRRQLRSDIAGDHGELNDDEIDEYRLVDFEGIGRSFKRKLIERRKQRAIKKAEKAKRAEALAKQKAERKALEAEQRREAKEAAEAERARIAQERAEAREAAANAAAAQRATVQESHETVAAGVYSHYERDGYAEAYDNEIYDNIDEQEHSAPAYVAQDSVVRAHPTLEKALRHDVNGEHAKETLTHADEMVVISVLSRDPEGFEGGKLLELMMACGLRYSRTMGVFHRFETESDDSELQFSMVNVLKPGTFPIEEMDEFVTPGITFLMPLPGATDSSAAFEAMVETAMVVVRHMGGELKDENHSVMTAQTIEFARQRVHEFERRHRLHRHMQAR
ncbi:cell division protein ZipA [Vreelandella olivaria]|uniref:cell division protein ZipA n=1 Tax=Vreelandella olivaria TaxID=390919 RepID=UPI00201F300A|nr:cell division protein ZipA [Halomonas olivaria]